MVTGESRSELLNWVNELLALNYTKVEQCGTGAAYCQILDSIFQDIPMSKVTFELTGSQYNFYTNYKILQSCFVRHQITKPIPVEKLIRCKFQDNLEFLQWVKRYWRENKDESAYDAQARRRGAKGVPRNGSGAGVRSRTVSGATSGTNSSSSMASSGTASSGTARRVLSNGSAASLAALQQQVKSLHDELAHSQATLQATVQDLEEYKTAGEGLETERNFYFNKLREIEILTQSVQELVATNSGEVTVTGLLSQIEEILYSTEEGFQVPEGDGESDSHAGIAVASPSRSQQAPTSAQAHGQMVLDDDTF